MRVLIYWSLALLTAVNVHALKVSTTGRCGKSNGLVCTGSAFGNCCSQSGWCGTSSSHCGAGCDKNFGTCTTTASSYGSTVKVSHDGTCGGSKGLTCQGSSFGNCCSAHGYCGSTSAYCGTGCNSKFGSCARVQTTLSTHPTSIKASPSSAAPKPSPTGNVSTNARCGYTHGATEGFSCLGSQFGECCSEYSYCGSGSAYCGAKCQSGYGRCTFPQSSSSIRPFSTMSPSSTMRATSPKTTLSSYVSSAIRSSTASSPASVRPSAASTSSFLSSMVLSTPLSTIQPSSLSLSAPILPPSASSPASSSIVESPTPIASSTPASSSEASSIQQTSESPSPSPSSITPTLDMPPTTPTASSYSSGPSDSSSSVSESITIPVETPLSSSTPISTSPDSSSTPIVSPSPSPEPLDPTTSSSSEIVQTSSDISSTPTPSPVITSSTVAVSSSLVESSSASVEEVTSTTIIATSTSISTSDISSEVPTSSVDTVSSTSTSISESSAQTSSSMETVPSSTPELSSTVPASSDVATTTSSSVETTPIATTSTVEVSSPTSSVVSSTSSSAAVPAPTPFTPGLITNGGFEDPSVALPRGGAGSTVILRESTPELPAYGGTRYLEFNMAQTAVAASRGISLVFPNIPGVQGTTYRVSFAVRSQTGMLSPQCYVHFAFGVNVIESSYFTGGSAWEEVSTNFLWNFGTGLATPIMVFSCPGNAAYSFGVDNIQVLEVANPPAIPEALPTPFRNAPPQDIPSVGATCGQAVQEPSFELFPAAIPTALSPWEFGNTRYILPYTYSSTVETKRSGTRALRVAVNALSSGYTASMGLRQHNVVICPNTLYEFKSWNVIFNTNSRFTCQVGLEVNGRMIAMGDPFAYTASREFTPTSGYYLTGPSETVVNLDLKLYCVGPIGISSMSATYFDDVTFTPVSSL